MSRTGFLKRLFVSICLIVASIVSIGAATLTSNDPNWLGARESFSNTEGNDFWLTFMNNAMFDPDGPNNESITFELKVAISAREDVSINIDIAGLPVVTNLPVAAGTTVFQDLSAHRAQIYLLMSESPTYKGVHVYTEDKDKRFSCFSYCRVGERVFA